MNLKSNSFTICLKYFLIQIILFSAFTGIASSQDNNYRKFLQEITMENNPEKLRAAKYLTDNIAGKIYLDGKGLKNFDEIFNIMEDMQKSRRIENQDLPLKLKMDSLIEEYGDPWRIDPETLEDSATISRDFLKENLEYALKVKSEKKWLNNVSLETFYEYVLPYRVATERLEDHQRMKLYNFYNFIKKSSKARQESFDQKKSTDMMKFASDVQYEISRRLSTNGTMWGYPFDVPISKMEKGRQGSCRHLVNYTTAAMRSVGLPVTSDFTIRWGNSYTGHKWNVLFLEDGNELPFDAGSPTLSFNIKERKIVKVYREQFAMDTTFIAPLDSDVPNNLYSAYWKDVTKKYIGVADIAIEIPKDIAEMKSYVLIGTFNNSEWEPQFYAKISKRKALFNEIGVDNVYIAMYAVNGTVKTFGHPFKVDSVGRIKYLTVRKKSSYQVLERKYPRNSWVKSYENSMVGGKFEYANDKSFSDAKLLLAIDKAPDSVVKINLTPEKYRYARYIFPDSQKVYIAEISFLKDNQIIDIKPMLSDIDEGLLKINDEDVNTYYWGKKGQSIVYDFGRPVEIDAIHFVPRSDSNFIVEGHEYELCYWDSGEWKPLEKTIASSSRLKFRNVPQNALYILHNLTKGKEERIFTYEKGAQIWW
jgi:hypothetical protein